MKALIALWLSFMPQEPAVVGPPEPCARPCQVSEVGVLFVSQFEGFMPFVYKDSAGLDTIGFGHLVKPGEMFEGPMLPEDANKLLHSDLAVAVKGVNRRVAVPLRQSQFDALASFTFNVGEGALNRSTLLKRVNEQRHVDCRPEFLKWNRAGGMVVAGLTRRRGAEADLYDS